MKINKLNAAFFVSSILLVFSSTSFAENWKDQYENKWHEEFNLKITKTLSSKNIRGCGEFKYRPSVKHSDEYLVYCTRDGKNWSAYLVWTKVNDVMGPYKADLSLK